MIRLEELASISRVHVIVAQHSLVVMNRSLRIFALIKIVGATKRVKFPTLFVLNWWVDNDANSICNIVGATASVD